MNLTFTNRFAALRGDRKSSRGFTMIEMMFVIFIILVLIAMAGGRYEKSVIRAREAVLKQDLQTMRNAIQQYTLDKAAGPQSIDDLVSAGYLREVPVDPMARARDWRTSRPMAGSIGCWTRATTRDVRTPGTGLTDRSRIALCSIVPRRMSTRSIKPAMG